MTTQDKSDQTTAPNLHQSDQRTLRPRHHPTDIRYWKKRVQTRTNSGFHIQISWKGKRERFPLGTANRDAAAERARAIYGSLDKHGWDATRAEFKPWTVKTVVPPTSNVGELLRQVKAISDLKPTTFEVYALKFRTLVAGVMDIQQQRRVSDFTKGAPGRARVETIKCECGRRVTVRLAKNCSADQLARIAPTIVCTKCLQTQWRAAVDATNLSELSDASVQTWKVAALKKASDDPVQLRRARATVASILRSSKALFSKKVRKHLTVPLPDPLPFAGVSIERVTNRYRSQINPKQLAQIAKRELEVAYPEHFKIFVLALGAGLRRDEIDTLTWKQIDWANRTIRVETNTYTTAKNERSEDTVDVDATVTEFFRQHMRLSKSEFVINSDVAPRPAAKFHHYRCNRIFRELTDWLRRKGVDAHMPLHTLRKEYGSLICQRAGIFAASSALRHSNIKLTRDTYVDKKNRIELPFGELMQKSQAEQLELLKGENAA